jgi:hypothetical protein
MQTMRGFLSMAVALRQGVQAEQTHTRLWTVASGKDVNVHQHPQESDSVGF